MASRFDICAVAVNGRELVVMDCARCGEVFGVTRELERELRRTGNGFHCPNGHNLSFSLVETAERRELREAQQRASRAESDATAARREAQQQKQMREWAESRAKGANIAAGRAKAAKQRLEHRVECGVCPHCQRTFKQLAAHMKSKHAK